MTDVLKIVVIAVPCLVAFRMALALEGTRAGAMPNYRRVRHFLRVLAVGFVATQFAQSIDAPSSLAFVAQLAVVVAAMYGMHRVSQVIDRAAVDAGRYAADSRRLG